MKINVTKVLKNNKGEDVILEGGKDKMTLKDVMASACLVHDEKENGQQKHKMYKTWKKIMNSTDEVELDTGIVSTIKDKIAKAYTVLIVGQAYDMIEGDE